MADGQPEKSQKTEDPTPRRKQEARNKGNVAKSTDLNGAIAMMVAAVLTPMLVATLGEELISKFLHVISQPPTDISPASVLAQASQLVSPLLLALLPLAAGLLVSGLVVNFAQVGFILSAEPMKPTFEKINPIAGLKRIFSRRALVEGLKATAKLFLFSWMIYALVSSRWDEISSLAALSPLEASQTVGGIIQTFFMQMAMVWLVIAALDFAYQKYEHLQNLKMTKEELKREMKDQEGSPEIKFAVMRRRRQILKGGMAKKVREADVLITNPTHFAIAISYKRNTMHAPVVSAKGLDHLALKMREVAKEAGVPIVENRPLARALYDKCEAGDFVPRELFGPVAEVLAYVLKSVKKAKRAA